MSIDAAVSGRIQRVDKDIWKLPIAPPLWQREVDET
jgi:hypothetical protein